LEDLFPSCPSLKESGRKLTDGHNAYKIGIMKGKYTFFSIFAQRHRGLVQIGQQAGSSPLAGGCPHLH